MYDSFQGDNHGKLKLGGCVRLLFLEIFQNSGRPTHVFCSNDNKCEKNWAVLNLVQGVTRSFGDV